MTAVADAWASLLLRGIILPFRSFGTPAIFLGHTVVAIRLAAGSPDLRGYHNLLKSKLTYGLTAELQRRLEPVCSGDEEEVQGTRTGRASTRGRHGVSDEPYNKKSSSERACMT